MTLKLTAASFLAGVKQSGLIDPDRLDALVNEIHQAGIDCNDSMAIATALVDRKALTEWQSDKLLQGRHKGFILGRYRLLSLLGAGEMSAVYLAEHILMERRCAIKVLPANKVQDTSYLGRFHREARAVASMNHANIVRAYDVDKQTESGTDIHFLVMEYVEGRNIEQIVKEQGPLDYVSAVDYIRQAADGLGHAHQSGMVHRDVKPGNLLIDNTGVVKLLDLGLARFFKTTDEESLTIKHDEKVLGTADYLAPEQAVDSHQVDARADIYSLGCTMYFALTGHPPFTDGTLVQRLLAHQTKVPPSVRYERPDIDDSLLEILDKMMAKKAADRYQTASEVSEALARWLIEHASAAWKQKHMMLVAALCGMDALHAGRVNEQAALVLKGKEASVLAAESMADDRSINDDSQSGSSSSKIERPRQRRPRERQPGSSVRLSSSTTDTAISRQIDPVQHVASRLSGPAAAMPTSNSAPQPVAPAPAPAVRSNDITLQLRLTERMRLVLIAIGMLATIIICGFGMWYIMSQKNPVEEGKPSIPSKANVPANAPAGNSPAGSIQAGARSV
ncbi:MAG: serine/threonine-protein kinase [Planctomycetaceae bacterium]